MKTYKKCEPCKSDGLILCGEELQPCENCNGVGYIETEIPVEQALEALKRADGVLELYQCGINGGCPCEAGNCEIIQIREAIKALEECIK